MGLPGRDSAALHCTLPKHLCAACYLTMPATALHPVTSPVTDRHWQALTNWLKGMPALMKEAGFSVVTVCARCTLDYCMQSACSATSFLLLGPSRLVRIASRYSLPCVCFETRIYARVASLLAGSQAWIPGGLSSTHEACKVRSLQAVPKTQHACIHRQTLFI